MVGVVCGLARNKGRFGFVSTEAGFFFFLGSAAPAGLTDGTEVNFWLDDDKKKPGRLQAVDLSIRPPADIQLPQSKVITDCA